MLSTALECSFPPESSRAQSWHGGQDASPGWVRHSVSAHLYTSALPRQFPMAECQQHPGVGQGRETRLPLPTVLTECLGAHDGGARLRQGLGLGPGFTQREQAVAGLRPSVKVGTGFQEGKNSVD